MEFLTPCPTSRPHHPPHFFCSPALSCPTFCSFHTWGDVIPIHQSQNGMVGIGQWTYLNLCQSYTITPGHCAIPRWPPPHETIQNGNAHLAITSYHGPLTRYLKRFPTDFKGNCELVIPECITARAWPLSVKKALEISQWLPPYRKVWQCLYHLGLIPWTTWSFVIWDHSWPGVSWLFFLIYEEQTSKYQ